MFERAKKFVKENKCFIGISALALAVDALDIVYATNFQRPESIFSTVKYVTSQSTLAAMGGMAIDHMNHKRSNYQSK